MTPPKKRTSIMNPKDRDRIAITVKKTTHQRFSKLKKKFVGKTVGRTFDNEYKTHSDFLDFLLDVYIEQKERHKPNIVNSQ